MYKRFTFINVNPLQLSRNKYQHINCGMIYNYCSDSGEETDYISECEMNPDTFIKKVIQ